MILILTTLHSGYDAARGRFSLMNNTMYKQKGQFELWDRKAIKFVSDCKGHILMNKCK